MTLGILEGKPKEPTGFRFIKEISKYGDISEECKKWYTSERPCWYEELDHRIFTCDKSELVMFNKEAKVGSIGNTYFKIPDTEWRCV